MVGRFVILAALAGALTLAPCGSAGAAPADLDHSFGGDGIVDVEGPAGATFSHEASADMAIGPEDEIFVLYSAFLPCSGPFGECPIDLAVTRYDRNGQRDASFGTGANSQLVVHQDPLAHAFDLAVGPDGRPVVAASNGGAMVVARFDREGHLDGTFGAGGAVPGGFGVRGQPTVAVQADGKIVVAAEGGGAPPPSELVLARYLPSGDRDPSFGNDGEAVVQTATRSNPAGVLLGADGGISVAIPQCCGGQPLAGNGVGFARFLAGGQPDAGFAGAGQLFFPTQEEGAVNSIALAPDGGIFAVFEDGGKVGLLTKLLPSGTVDRGFGGEGEVHLFTRIGAVSPSDIAVDPQGRLVGIGWDSSIAAFRLRPDGSVDRTFNGGQHVTVAIGGNQEAPLALGLQSSGRIVALGETSCCGPKVFALIGLHGGTDHTRCLRHKATIVGTNGPDVLTGTPHRDVIAALGGKDTVRGLAGADLICGGKGRDKISGGPGQDIVRE